MNRHFFDQDLRRWEAYVTGGQPGSVDAARIFFICREDSSTHPRYVRHESGDAATAQRELLACSDDELIEMLDQALPLELIT